jgi:hypothetical protein
MPGFGQQPGGVADWLLQLLRPAEAEAVVVPKDAASQQLVEAVATGKTMPPGKETNPLITGAFDPLKKDIYRHVYEAAHARPETVPVSFTEDLSLPSAVGEYRADPAPGGEIRIRPRGLETERGFYPQVPPTAISQQETLTHELLHFLMTQAFREMQQQVPRPPNEHWINRWLGGPPHASDVREAFRFGEPQHKLIRYLLGGDTSPPSLAEHEKHLPLFQAPAGNDAAWTLYNAFFKQLFPEGPLRERATLQLPAPQPPHPAR